MADHPIPYFELSLQRCPVIAILRGLLPESAAATSLQLLEAGVELVEITIQDIDGLRCLESVAEALAASGRKVGAGSVTSVEGLHRVIDAGAAFAISPGLDAAIVNAARAIGIPYLPAVATPSELQRALSLGMSEMKLFPARYLGGPGFVRALGGPFPGASLVPTGGLSLADVDEYIAAGAIGVGIGTELTQSEGVAVLRRWLCARNRRSE